MKLLSVAIPCYNSENYMRNAVESVLPVDSVEVIIVDDGSMDRTADIADEYAFLFPDKVRVIHQANGGHGAAVNAGMQAAEGIFFKVLDSDDCLNTKALEEIMQVLERSEKEEWKLDAVFANYVYDKKEENTQHTVRYTNVFPTDRLFSWKETKRFHQGQYLLMHSIIYRTEVLLACGLSLPRKTFYVDNIFAYQPLPFVNKMYYCNTDLYFYYIGRDDQSVSEKNMIKRIDQQLRVTDIMINNVDLWSVQETKCREYMLAYLGIMMTVSSIYLIKEGSQESLEKRDRLWDNLREKDEVIYQCVSRGIVNRTMRATSYFGRQIAKTGYRVSRAIFKFG